MLTSHPFDKPTALFFFAHQDDEFGVFQAILSELERGREVVCIYLTSNFPFGSDPLGRNNESTRVLEKLGVKHIVFAGDILQILDGKLIEHIQSAYRFLDGLLRKFMDVRAIYVLAWEGGHPDHDSLHAIVLKICENRQIIDLVRQFSIYNSFNCPWHFFRVLAPLEQNGPIVSSKIPIKNRMLFLSYLFYYKSQFKTWIGLFPFVLLHYLVKGTQDLQAVSNIRLKTAPHMGHLYYEKRKFSDWPQLSKAIELLNP